MIKKPKILSDEELAKIVNDATGAKKIAPKTCPPLVTEKWVAQAQNDYCYKEMLGQFISWIEKHGHPSRDTWHWEIDRKDWQALQT